MIRSQIVSFYSAQKCDNIDIVKEQKPRVEVWHEEPGEDKWTFPLMEWNTGSISQT